MEEDIARRQGIALAHLVKSLPVLHRARRQAAPCPRARVEYLHLWWIVASRIGIQLQLRQCGLRALWIRVGQARAEKDAKGRRGTHGVTGNIFGSCLPRSQNEIPCRRLRIGNVALPGVRYPPLYAA